MMSNHDRFLEHLRDSQEAKVAVARWINSQGHAVTVCPDFEAPDASQHAECADQGDLYVSQRVEVKRLGRNFTGRDDWPFREFIVCEKKSWDRARPKPYC